jgi:hypothetical protein
MARYKPIFCCFCGELIAIKDTKPPEIDEVIIEIEGVKKRLPIEKGKIGIDCPFCQTQNKTEVRFVKIC